MESNAVEKWLNDTLKADAALTAVVSTRVYNTRRAEGSALPCVIYQMQAPGTDMVMLGGVRVWANMLYLIRGVAEQGSYGGNLATIAGRIDTLLHAKSGSNANGIVWTCVRESPFQMVEVVDGQEYRQLGGLYRIQAK